MLATIDVYINAARPEIPLAPFRAHLGSPSALRIRNVPRKIGEWDITSVSYSVNYPDGTTESVECVQVGGVWVGTVAGSATPGKSAAGFIVTADGTDERGNAVDGYILGVGDVEIVTRESSVTPGTVTFKGDRGDDGLTPYIGENGNWWIGGVDTGKPSRGQPGEGIDVDDAVTETSPNPVKSSGVWSWVKSLLLGFLPSESDRFGNIVIRVPESRRIRIVGKGGSVGSITLENEPGTVSLSVADTDYVDGEIESHNTDLAAHSAKFAKYRLKTDSYSRAETDDKINQFAAHYLTSDAAGSAFATVDALTGATAYYYAGEEHTPDKNDYAVVLNDGGKTARWAYFGETDTGTWQRQYYINETALTEAQWAAVNSGITAELVASIGIQLVHDTESNVIKLGTRTITSFAELKAMVQTGRAVLIGKATTAHSSSPVIFRPHLVGATDIYFDATGTISGGVYTRRIAVMKNGEDGISVTQTDLTPIAKKGDIPTVSKTFTPSDSGKAADAAKVGEALGKRLSTSGGTVNGTVVVNGHVFACGPNGEQIQLAEYGQINVIKYDDVTGDLSDEIQLGLPDNSGTLALTSDVAAATKLKPVWSYANVSEGLKARMPFSMIYGEEFGGWEVFGSDGNVIDGVPSSKDDTVVDFAVGASATNSGIVATIVGYTTANGEYVSAQTAAQVKALAEVAVEDKITSEDQNLVALIKKYGGTQIKEDEKGFYYEVEEA